MDFSIARNLQILRGLRPASKVWGLPKFHLVPSAEIWRKTWRCFQTMTPEIEGIERAEIGIDEIVDKFDALKIGEDGGGLNEVLAKHLPSIRLIKDLGFHRSYLCKEKSESRLSFCKKKVEKFIEFDALPRLIADVTKLQASCPVDFCRLRKFNPSEGGSKFNVPTEFIVPLIVAEKKLALSDGNGRSGLGCIDFLVGGSVLGAFGVLRGKSCDQYITQRIGNIICVKKASNYISNQNDVGHQFERFVCGNSFSDAPDPGHLVHVQLLQIGNFRVLVSAEVDGGEQIEGTGNIVPVEVKANVKARWKQELPMQMVSSGSLKLIHGVKGGTKTNPTLTDVNTYSLDELFGYCRMKSPESKRSVEEKILRCFNSLKKTYIAENSSYMVVLNSSQDLPPLSIELMYRSSFCQRILPPARAVRRALRI